MAYQISYSENSIVKKVKFVRKLPVKWIVCFIALLLAAGLLQMESLQNFLIPGDPTETKAAFSAFTQELREGERFQDAAAAFCRQLIERDRIA